MHADGRFEQVGSPFSMYGSMLAIRVHVVDLSFQMAAQAVTIATRYSAVRRQGAIKPG